MYQSVYRQRLRPYIETKLAEELVRQPWVVAAPASWCSCEEQEEARLPSCPVHGRCEQCESVNGVCDCGWWWDQHFCNTCG